MHELTEEMRAAIAKALRVAGKDSSDDAVEQAWTLSNALLAIDGHEPWRFEVVRTIPGHGTPDEVADRIEACCFDGESDGVTVVDGELVTIRRVRTMPSVSNGDVYKVVRPSDSATTGKWATIPEEALAPPPMPEPRNRHERRAQAAQQRRAR